MASSHIHVRPAVLADVEAMVALLQDLFALEADFHPDPERQRRGLRLLLNNDGNRCTVLVAESGDTVVGMATLQCLVSTAEGGRVGLIEDVVVRSDFRLQGIGRLLLKSLCDIAVREGLSRLQLLADNSNGAGLDFYYALGWAQTDLSALRFCPRLSSGDPSGGNPNPESAI